MARPPDADADADDDVAPAGPVDQHVWLACAVPLSRLPAVGSQVFYFPCGHAEQCPTAPPDPSPAHHVFPCTVTAVQLSADAKTDEPYATISLVPGPHHDEPQPPVPAPTPAPAPAPAPDQPKREFSYYAKQLTQSDANNGGGFSIPRSCADQILPPLDFNADPPLQKLRIKDLQGKEWEFRHIYRGTPRRHLLTTGWSKFVNAKLLVAADTVVFMRRPDGELLVGVRRAARYGGDPPRNARARVPAEEVVEAVRLAASGAAFTVTYYPRQGAGEFVVPREEVEEGVRSGFMPGMQVRMQVMEAEDTRRTAWATGTVKNSYQTMWRMLQVEWDPSTASASTMNRYVNSWQVQHAGVPHFLHRPDISDNTAAPDPSALLVPQVPAMAMLLPSQIPAGMQEARHDDVPADAPYSSAANEPARASLPRDFQIPVPPHLSAASSDIGNPQNESPPNNLVDKTVIMFPPDIPDQIRSIQLFGTTITSPVQIDPKCASEQVKQFPQGTDDETAHKGDPSATAPLEPPSNGHNQNGSEEGA